MKVQNKVHYASFFLVAMLILGTLVYHLLEGWSYLDAMYFSTTTIATVGLGDIHPVTGAGKFFTIFYVIFGVGTAVYTFTLLAEGYFEKHSGNFQKNVDRTVGHITRLKDSSKERLEKIAESGKYFAKDREEILKNKDEYMGK